MSRGKIKMVIKSLKTGLSMFNCALNNTRQGLLSLILVLVLSSYIAAPDNTGNSINKQNVDCTGLIASNFVHIA